MSSVSDWLFGDQNDTTGIKYQEAANRRTQQYAQESTDAARQDILDVFPRAEEAYQQSARSALQTARRAPQSQLNVLSRAGINAQRAILGGMDAYQNAIMGRPTGIGGEFGQNPAGLRPVMIGMSSAAKAGYPFQTEKPLWLGSRDQDLKEVQLQRQSPSIAWRGGSPLRSVNINPEQYRRGVQYDYDNEETFGGMLTPRPDGNLQGKGGYNHRRFGTTPGEVPDNSIVPPEYYSLKGIPPPADKETGAQMRARVGNASAYQAALAGQIPGLSSGGINFSFPSWSSGRAF